MVVRALPIAARDPPACWPGPDGDGSGVEAGFGSEVLLAGGWGLFTEFSIDDASDVY